MNQTNPSNEPGGDLAPTATALTPYVCPRRCAEAIDWYIWVFAVQSRTARDTSIRTAGSATPRS